MKYTLERLHLARTLAARHQAQWARTKNLMLVMLGLWISYFLVVHIFITRLNRVILPVLDLPLGTYLAMQGTLLVFLVSLFCFARRQS